MTQVCASIALALALSTTTVFADPPADKGKGKGNDGRDDNHGQVVSECNHRANERNLKGKDRKEWTEWCEDRGSRHNYDYRRYSSDRNCYQKADNKCLTGDKRRKFINDCLDIPNRY
jgi:hypothetical protein